MKTIKTVITKFLFVFVNICYLQIANSQTNENDKTHETQQIKIDSLEYRENLSNEYPPFEFNMAEIEANIMYPIINIGDNVNLTLKNQRGRDLAITGVYKGKDILGRLIIGDNLLSYKNPDIPKSFLDSLDINKTNELRKQFKEDAFNKYNQKKKLIIENQVENYLEKRYKKIGLVYDNGEWVTPEEKSNRLSQAREAKRKFLEQKRRLEESEWNNFDAYLSNISNSRLPLEEWEKMLMGETPLYVIGLLGDPDITVDGDTKWIYWDKTFGQNSQINKPLVLRFRNKVIFSVRNEIF